MEFFLSVLFIFRSILRNGNLDLFYFFSIINFIWLTLKKTNLEQKCILLLFPLIISVIIAMLFAPYYSSIAKSIIYLAKLFLNINLMFMVKEYIHKIDIRKFVIYTSKGLFILTILAMILRNSILWRNGDLINKYTQSRLQLLYLEPSLLGMSVSVLIIIISYLIIKEGYKRDLIFYLLILFIILYLSAGMNGLVSLVLALGAMIIIFNYKMLLKKSIHPVLFMVIPFAIIVFIWLLNTDFAMILRLKDIIAGKDGSFNFRYTKSLNILKHILINTKGCGVGLGNLNAEVSLNFLNYMGMSEAFANSFQYFIAEAGYIGVICLILGNIYLIYKATHGEKMIMIPFWVFIFVYQIAGGYFTNPLIWAVYGLILSKAFQDNDNKAVFS